MYPGPGQPYPGQGYPPQPYPGQPYPGQGYPPQPYPGQPYPGQGYPPQPYPGQPYPEQPFPVQGPYTPTSSTTSVTTNVAVTFMPIFTYPPNDPLADARRLHKAIAGLGTDDSTLIEIITHRSKLQLQQIADVYAKEHKHTLEKDIKGDTSGNYCKLLCDIIKPVLTLKVEFLQNAIRGLGTRESIVIDVITQSTNAEILAMKNIWPNMEKDVAGDTSGNFRKVLMDLMTGRRQEITMIDDQLAMKLAHDLYKAGEDRLGTDDSKFVEIMTTYSPYFLDRVSYHYQLRHKHTLQSAIERETSGDYKDALLACTRPPDVYFAHRLYRAMKGLGTDDVGLIYVFSIHDKAQLQQIAKTYEFRGYGSLVKDIEGDTSGNYRKTLLSALS